MIDILHALIGLSGGYLLGSIPFGLVLTRLAGLGDIRTIGSGNIGTTNVLRTGRKDLAFLTLICDSGKGALAVILLSLLSPSAMLGAALGSVVGHLYPVWLKFKGGKGVATTLGVMIAMTPLAGLLTCAAWLLTAIIFRISSLSALIAVLTAPFSAAILYGIHEAFITAILAVLIWIKHVDNIKRIMNRTEPKIGKSKK